MISCVSRLDTKLRRSSEVAYRCPAGFPSTWYFCLHIGCPAFPLNPEYSLEGLMLKLQHLGHLMQRADSLEKTLMLGKIEGKRSG